MLTSKQRAKLRALANDQQPIFQIGKNGISDVFCDEIGEALEKRELIKCTVLETAMLTARQAAEAVAEATGADVVQCIGSRFVLYRESKKNKLIEL
ncbi:ribosome assembly RNA-binding protein YhbY [Feifania hominis]|uniref:Ribosome assembly RNA-binding protein YhbY n=1 Tax=Feifania hominis TaxID=2763660 RepID=A0A926DD87_9FIRM|nr:ribosome assembly RNA-binding protein YhbY [Feifania hominis]MBC8535706.1 ribosome assembly RNA-binding protein YhbY [Feifania hominis]